MTARTEIALSILLIGWGGCSGFERVAPDATHAAPTVLPDGAPIDREQPPPVVVDAAVDAPAPPPEDTACGHFWTDPRRTCSEREVLSIEAMVIDPGSLTVTRSTDGELALVYHRADWADEGTLRVVRFAEGETDIGPLDTRELAGSGKFERVGVVSAAAVDDEGALHLAYLHIGSFGNDLLYRRMPAGQDAGPVEVVRGSFAPSAELGLVVTDDDVHVAFFDPLERTLYVRRRARLTGEWLDPQPVATNLMQDIVGAGQLALSGGVGVRPALAYHHTAKGWSKPRYVRFDGVFWSGARTIDNHGGNGVSGWSVDLLGDGDEQQAVYFSHGEGLATLRLARWNAADTTPRLELLEQGIPLVGDPFRHRVAAAVDGHGLLHLAAVLPAAATRGSLEYWRQVRVGAQIRWLTDLVDDDVVDPYDRSLVDIVVSPEGRPHIVYFNGAGEVRYATRWDR